VTPGKETFSKRWSLIPVYIVPSTKDSKLEEK
jgi:hypothetical protein